MKDNNAGTILVAIAVVAIIIGGYRLIADAQEKTRNSCQTAASAEV